MGRLLRLHIRPTGGLGDPQLAFQFCLDRGVIGIGWAVAPTAVPVKDWDSYVEAATAKYGSGGISRVRYFRRSATPGTLVWTRNPNGRYTLRLCGTDCLVTRCSLRRRCPAERFLTFSMTRLLRILRRYGYSATAGSLFRVPRRKTPFAMNSSWSHRKRGEQQRCRSRREAKHSTPRRTKTTACAHTYSKPGDSTQAQDRPRRSVCVRGNS